MLRVQHWKKTVKVHDANCDEQLNRRTMKRPTLLEVMSISAIIIIVHCVHHYQCCPLHFTLVRVAWSFVSAFTQLNRKLRGCRCQTPLISLHLHITGFGDNALCMVWRFAYLFIYLLTYLQWLTWHYRQCDSQRKQLALFLTSQVQCNCT